MERSHLDAVGGMLDALGRVALEASTGRMGLPRPDGSPAAWLEFVRGRLVEIGGADPAFGREPAAALLKRLSAWILESDPAQDPVLVERAPADEQEAGARKTGLTAADLVIGICRCVEDVEWLRQRAFPKGDDVMVAGATCPTLPGAAVGPEEAFLMSRLEHSSRGAEIVSLSPAGETRTLQALAALRALGMMTDAGTEEPSSTSTLAELEEFLDTTSGSLPTAAAAGPAYTPEQTVEREELLRKSASLAGLDYYAILEVDRRAREDEIRKSYYHLARLYHPDRFHRPHLEDMHRRLEEMFAAITEAYNTLQDPRARTEYDASLIRGTGARDRDSGQDKLAVARDAYLRGRKHLDAGETFEALRLFESAVQNDPQRPEYLHYLARCQGQNPRWRKRAEENLLKAIELNPAQTASYLELARLYRKGKLEKRSVAMYEKVLEWDPDNREALQAIEQAKQDASGGSGFLGSIFRKD